MHVTDFLCAFGQFVGKRLNYKLVIICDSENVTCPILYTLASLVKCSSDPLSSTMSGRFQATNINCFLKSWFLVFNPQVSQVCIAEYIILTYSYVLIITLQIVSILLFLYKHLVCAHARIDVYCACADG